MLYVPLIIWDADNSALFSMSRYTILKIYSRQMNDDEMREKHVGGMNSRVPKKHLFIQHSPILYCSSAILQKRGEGQEIE